MQGEAPTDRPLRGATMGFSLVWWLIVMATIAVAFLLMRRPRG